MSEPGEANLVALSRARSFAASGRGRRIRRAAKITVNEMGAAVGNSGSAVSLWERGLRDPRGAAAVRWVTVLDLLDRAVQEQADMEVIESLVDGVVATKPSGGSGRD